MTLVPYGLLCAPCRRAVDFRAGRADYSAMIRLKMQVPCADCVDAEKARQFVTAAQENPMTAEEIRDLYRTYSVDTLIRNVIAKVKP